MLHHFHFLHFQSRALQPKMLQIFHTATLCIYTCIVHQMTATFVDISIECIAIELYLNLRTDVATFCNFIGVK